MEEAWKRPGKPRAVSDGSSIGYRAGQHIRRRGTLLRRGISPLTPNSPQFITAPYRLTRRNLTGGTNVALPVAGQDAPGPNHEAFGPAPWQKDTGRSGQSLGHLRALTLRPSPPRSPEAPLSPQPRPGGCV